MTPVDLRRLAEPVWGRVWQARLSRRLRMSDRHMRRLASGEAAITPALECEIRAAITAEIAERAAEDAAYAVVAPLVDDAVAATEAAGHHPADALAGILSRTVDLMRKGAGIPATIETLRETISEMQSREDEEGL